MSGLEGDPGLQPQRTALAWRRTALAVGGAGVVTAAAWARLGAAGPAVVAALLGGLVAVRLLHRPVDGWRGLAPTVAVAVALALLGVAAAARGLVT